MRQKPADFDRGRKGCIEMLALQQDDAGVGRSGLGLDRPVAVALGFEEPSVVFRRRFGTLAGDLAPAKRSASPQVGPHGEVRLHVRLDQRPKPQVRCLDDHGAAIRDQRAECFPGKATPRRHAWVRCLP